MQIDQFAQPRPAPPSYFLCAQTGGNESSGPLLVVVVVAMAVVARTLIYPFQAPSEVSKRTGSNPVHGLSVGRASSLGATVS
ncbi:hypothetical protein E2C01_083449 [Portunus trituberculatus]|uniref:Uncharacterized protein n=1 Tax=Portunus trituberculatus TaxID=210409 RepID=A0A5B7ISH0_PORTR|nr:hypothetical protein [Portunus trituberculatus]